MMALRDIPRDKFPVLVILNVCIFIAYSYVAVSTFCVVCGLIIICFSFLFSKYSTYVL